MNINRITTNAGRAPSVRDLNVNVMEILRCFGSGLNEAQIVERYVGLEKEDFLAVFNYAALIIMAHHVSERVVQIGNEMKADLKQK